MRRRWLIALVTLWAASAVADGLDDSNFRNAVELYAYSALCSDEAELASAYAKYAKSAGAYNQRQIDRAARSRAVAVRKDKQFCRNTRQNLPHFRAGVASNNPATNLAVPPNVIETARRDCNVAVPVRTKKFHRELYEQCIDNQVQGWVIQERYRRSN